VAVNRVSPSVPVQRYWERLPAPALAGHAASVWALEVGDGAAYEHRTIPNGSVEISYTIGADVVEVSGPQRDSTVARVAPGTAIVGIRLRPGLAPSILGQPSSELAELSVGVEEVFGREAAALAERLAGADSPRSAARLLEEEVTRRLATGPAADPLVAEVVRRLQPWIPSSVGERTADLFISPRQLRRRFVAAVGYGPKTLQRILRFQGFLALTQGHQDSRIDLARLAKRAGYADQAHLTRECSDLAGQTPRSFLEETWRSCGPNHDHDASFAGLRRALLGANRASAA
jgi:AraC-like DNA-binding protein